MTAILENHGLPTKGDTKPFAWGQQSGQVLHELMSGKDQ